MHRTSIDRFAHELALLRDVEIAYFDPNVLDALSGRDLDLHLRQALQKIGTLRHPRVLEELFATGAIHPDPDVRKFCLRYAARLAQKEPAARELVVWLLGDDEDHVIFEAIRIAGRERVGEAVGDLITISGPASNVMFGNVSRPVGVGGTLVVRALVQIFGTENPYLLRRLEHTFEDEGKLPEGTTFDDSVLYSENPSDVAGMTRVPAGKFVSGINEDSLEELRFDCSDVIPSSTVYLPEFLIDTYPVTNEQYDEWASSEEVQEHLLCHPDEPEGKDHRRNTWRDSRFGPKHPAVGVDWFDAYSYCAHHGKELPSEFEWEKAARGADGRLFPWGNDWDDEAARWAGAVFDQPIDDIWTWTKLLQQHDESFPSEVTTPVDAHPTGNSPYGVADMVGNAWEWTRTNSFTRRDLKPQTAERPRPEWATAEESFVVLKGGAWSCIPEEVSTFFRGRDILTDRHNEIGFRGAIR